MLYTPRPQYSSFLSGPTTCSPVVIAIASPTDAASPYPTFDIRGPTATRDNNCTIEFHSFGFSVKDFLTRHILLRCDSSGDLYPVTKPSTLPAAFLSTSSSTWSQCLGHPGDEVLRFLISRVRRGLHVTKQIKASAQGVTSTDFPLYARSARDTLSRSQAYLAICSRSTSGYWVFLGDNLLSWSAKRQHTFSRSSAEAEYRVVANVVAETAWLRNLLRELHSPFLTATLVYCDNVSAVYMSANPVQHQRTKHFEIDIHFVRDMVIAGESPLKQVITMEVIQWTALWNKKEDEFESEKSMLGGAFGDKAEADLKERTVRTSSETFWMWIFLWKETRLRQLMSSPGASSAGPSTPPNYSSRSSRNAECSNYKHLRGKISVLKATMNMHMHPEQNTVNSAALLHEVLNEMKKLDLE
nr:NBS-containing resistance-like protein [Tanacetum cinerariifolium]